MAPERCITRLGLSLPYARLSSEAIFCLKCAPSKRNDDGMAVFIRRDIRIRWVGWARQGSRSASSMGCWPADPLGVVSPVRFPANSHPLEDLFLTFRIRLYNSSRSEVGGRARAGRASMPSRSVLVGQGRCRRPDTGCRRWAMGDCGGQRRAVGGDGLIAAELSNANSNVENPAGGLCRAKRRPAVNPRKHWAKRIVKNS